MDNLQPGDTISNKWGTRRILAALPGVVLLNEYGEDNDRAGDWYTISNLKEEGYELTLNDEPDEDTLYQRIQDILVDWSDGARPLSGEVRALIKLFRSLERKDK